jgi:hypothetical protein
MDFERISVKLWWHFLVMSPSQKKDITDFWVLRMEIAGFERVDLREDELDFTLY